VSEDVQAIKAEVIGDGIVDDVMVVNGVTGDYIEVGPGPRRDAVSAKVGGVLEFIVTVWLSIEVNENSVQAGVGEALNVTDFRGSSAERSRARKSQEQRNRKQKNG
jgi:hypothetical protein